MLASVESQVYRSHTLRSIRRWALPHKRSSNSDGCWWWSWRVMIFSFQSNLKASKMIVTFCRVHYIPPSSTLLWRGFEILCPTSSVQDIASSSPALVQTGLCYISRISFSPFRRQTMYSVLYVFLPPQRVLLQLQTQSISSHLILTSNSSEETSTRSISPSNSLSALRCILFLPIRSYRLVKRDTLKDFRRSRWNCPQRTRLGGNQKFHDSFQKPSQRASSFSPNVRGNEFLNRLDQVQDHEQ